MEKLRLLVFIDDDRATNYFHEIIVKEAGICTSYQFFSRPEVALDYFRNLQEEESTHMPDGIFLDINMPEMDGWEFLEEYGKLNLKRSSPVIVMLTTSLRHEDQERAQQNQHVHKLVNKPLSKEKLFDLYETVLRELKK